MYKTDFTQETWMVIEDALGRTLNEFTPNSNTLDVLMCAMVNHKFLIDEDLDHGELDYLLSLLRIERNRRLIALSEEMMEDTEEHIVIASYAKRYTQAQDAYRELEHLRSVED